MVPVKLSAHAVGHNDAKYVEWAIDESTNTVLASQTLVHRRGPDTVIPINFAQYDKRQLIALLVVVPQILKEYALQPGSNTTAVNLLEDLNIHISQGCECEAASRMTYTRRTGTANTARDANDLMREWKMARERLLAVWVVGCCTKWKEKWR